MKLNKTNLNRILKDVDFNIDEGYIISNYFMFRITDLKALTLLKTFKLSKVYTYEKVKQFIMPLFFSQNCKKTL